MIKEDFLHYIWQLKKFNLSFLKSTDNETIELIDPGFQNTNAGPDFDNARLRIDDIVWVGNVEIHVFSSDWFKHRHHEDSAYNNVILHVVLKEDIPAVNQLGQKISCVELQDRLDKKELNRYRLLIHQKSWIPCLKSLENVKKISISAAIERALTDRLFRKASYIQKLLDKYNKNIEYVFLILLFRYFGSNVNTDAFERLALSIDQRIILKESYELLRLESYLFGQAAMLEKDMVDPYPSSLKKNYQYQKRKYKLKSMNQVQWKFMRMRPHNFPTIRIAQLAALIHKNRYFFNQLREFKTIKEHRKFYGCQASSYWDTHFRFDITTPKKNAYLSKSFCDLLIINTTVPFFFAYALEKSDQSYMDRAMDILLQLPPEKNTTIDGWKKTGISARTAFDTQALLELKNNFCNKKKCLSCAIGQEIMIEK